MQTANALLDVTARGGLSVSVNAAILTGTGTILLGADLTANETGDDGVGPLTIAAGAAVDVGERRLQRQSLCAGPTWTSREPSRLPGHPASPNSRPSSLTLRRMNSPYGLAFDAAGNH